MNLPALLHPVRLWRWYVRAAKVKKHHPWKDQYDYMYRKQMCWAGRLIVKVLAVFV